MRFHTTSFSYSLTLSLLTLALLTTTSPSPSAAEAHTHPAHRAPKPAAPTPPATEAHARALTPSLARRGKNDESDGCPVGWASCSATTCFPLDGSVCCADGEYCDAGWVVVSFSPSFFFAYRCKTYMG